ncbi:STAS domain-containing protein [Candidatus Zixiibacteriota bacterium]
MDEVSTNRTAVATEESALKIAVSNTGQTREISVVRIDGVVDTMTAGDLDQVISSLITRGRYRLVIDLAGVEYISSAGWGVFVSHLREIREHAGDIKLARMIPEVQEIYELLEFDGLLPFFDGLDPAVADFRGDGGRQSADSAAGNLITVKNAAEESPPNPELPEGDPSSTGTLDQAVLQLVAEDPFQTIREIRGQLQERQGGRYCTSWWKVFVCLRRQHMLSRRARFRYCRRMRKPFM